MSFAQLRRLLFQLHMWIGCSVTGVVMWAKKHKRRLLMATLVEEVA